MAMLTPVPPRGPFGLRSPLGTPPELFASAVLVLLCHASLALLTRFLSYSLSLLAMLPVASVVMLGVVGIGRCCKRLAGVPSSAQGMVLFNMLFLFGVYIVIISTAVPPLLNGMYYAECLLLLIGFYLILSGDPGLVTCEHSCSGVGKYTCSKVNLHLEDGPLLARVRQCNICKASVKGFDHHCPAFGNCIGQKNHVLFLILLIGLVLTESTYTMCASQYISEMLIQNGGRLEIYIKQSNLSRDLVISSMIFCILQVLWQVFFLLWHFYCVCSNIRTDEWINWKKYPEFQDVQGQPGQEPELRFTNPYDKGFVGNIKDFLFKTD